MKILITTDGYSPIINGVVTSVSNLYKELKCKGHNVKILTLSHTGDEKVAGDVYYLKSIGIGVYPGARIKFPLYNKLIKEIIKWNPDVIHSQTEFSMMLVSKYISNKLNVPHIHTYHTMYENYLDYLLGGKIINLLIVGGGPYLNNLKNQVKKQNIKDNVIFTGMITSEEVYKYYKMAEIFVTASTSETQGLTYIEALSSGCPVVCKYDPCIDGVIEQGKNGFSYKEKSEFTYYINKILRDTYLRDRMRKEAIIKANEYSSNTFANKVLNKYSRIIYANKEESISLVNLTNPKARKDKYIN